MNRKIFFKYLRNSCSDTEMNEVVCWADKEAFSEESVFQAFEDWFLYQPDDVDIDDKKLSLLFDKIQQQIEARNKKRILMKNWTHRLTQVAAILLLPVLLMLLFTIKENQTLLNYVNFSADSVKIVAPVGARAVVQLPDGSQVHLNYASSIKYLQYFSKDKREVRLMGEGYFDVVHDENKPFIVRTDRLNVNAVGTSFNVMAYPDDDFVETTLINGKVILNKNDTDGNIKSIGAMVPGQHVSFNKVNGSVECKQVNVEKFIAWKDGRLVFEDTPVVEMAKRLGRMFNTDIEVVDNAKQYTYTVTFIDESLPQILDLMKMAVPAVSFRIIPRKKLPDGTFSKQKIIISEKP
jgi:transmembrane sensor